MIAFEARVKNQEIFRNEALSERYRYGVKVIVVRTNSKQDFQLIVCQSSEGQIK